MMRFIPPRLRAPVQIIMVGAVAIAVAVAVYGWASVLYLGPFLLVAAAGYYAWAGRDSDTAAVMRRQADERQAYRQLKTQALVGRVMSAAAVVAYLVAVGVKATLWPFAIFVVIPALTLFAGSVLYRERGNGPDNDLLSGAR